MCLTGFATEEAPTTIPDSARSGQRDSGAFPPAAATGAIRTRPYPHCYLCGAPGEELYRGLSDRLYQAPGQWDLKRCPKPDCGLIWLDPMPIEEDIGKAYQTYFTHHTQDRSAGSPGFFRQAITFAKSAYLANRFNYGAHAGRPFRWFFALPMYLSAHRAELAIPLQYVARQKAGRFLDVGCGSGESLELAQSAGWSAEGVDFDPQAVAIARQRGLAVHCGQLSERGLADGSFDLVLMSHVIEHVHDPLALLSECRRVLRPGGTIVLLTPNSAGWGHLRFGSACVDLDPPRHLHIFNPRTLTTLAQRAGLGSVKASSSLRTTSFVFVQSRLISRTNRGDMFLKPTRPQALYGQAATLIEQLMLLWKPSAGEEILLEARK
jgi:SAM-dependent methyltransferase